MPGKTTLSEAVRTVEEFRDDWLADEQTVNELATKWAVSTYKIKAAALLLELPARRRGAKKKRVDVEEQRRSPNALTEGHWVPDARGIQHWQAG